MDTAMTSSSMTAYPYTIGAQVVECVRHGAAHDRLVQASRQHRILSRRLFASVRQNGDRRPALFDAAFLMTRHRHEYAMLDLPPSCDAS
jgi:hypothetical protein